MVVVPALIVATISGEPDGGEVKEALLNHLENFYKRLSSSQIII